MPLNLRISNWRFATLNNNALLTAASLTPIAITATTVSPQAAVRFGTSTGGEIEYFGTKHVYCSIHASVTINSNGNDDTYSVTLWKDSGTGPVELPGSEVSVQLDSGGAVVLQEATVAINYGTLFNNGDKLELRIASGGPNDCIIPSYQLVVRE